MLSLLGVVASDVARPGEALKDKHREPSQCKRCYHLSVGVRQMPGNRIHVFLRICILERSNGGHWLEIFPEGEVRGCVKNAEKRYPSMNFCTLGVSSPLCGALDASTIDMASWTPSSLDCVDDFTTGE
jgi:hypothetical protein